MSLTPPLISYSLLAFREVRVRGELAQNFIPRLALQTLVQSSTKREREVQIEYNYSAKF